MTNIEHLYPPRDVLLKKLGDLPHTQNSISDETLELLTGRTVDEVSNVFEEASGHLWYQIMTYYFCANGLTLFNLLIEIKGASARNEETASQENIAEGLYGKMNLSFNNIITKMEQGQDIREQRVLFRRLMDQAYKMLLEDAEDECMFSQDRKSILESFDLTKGARDMMIRGMLSRGMVVMSLEEIFRNALGDDGVGLLIQRLREG